MKKKLSSKQKAFADTYLDTKNATESAAQVYDVKNRNVAKAIGSENLAKPDIKAYLEEKANDAASMIYTLSQTAENEAVRLNASRDIMDRAGFQPVNKSDITSNGKTILGNGVIFKDFKDGTVSESNISPVIPGE